MDCPEFWALMDAMVDVNNRLTALSNGSSSTPALLRPLERLVCYERMASLLLRVLAMKPVASGSWDYVAPSTLTY